MRYVILRIDTIIIRGLMNRRNSFQRRMILDVLKREDHPTAQEVFHYIHEDYPRISLGTVYRNLNLMTDEGTLRRLSFPDSPDRYDIHTQPHQHFVCRLCGRYFNIDAGNLGNIDDVRRATGFAVEECCILFKGICQDCLKKTKEDK